MILSFPVLASSGSVPPTELIAGSQRGMSSNSVRASNFLTSESFAQSGLIISSSVRTVLDKCLESKISYTQHEMLHAMEQSINAGISETDTKHADIPFRMFNCFEALANRVSNSLEGNLKIKTSSGKSETEIENSFAPCEAALTICTDKKLGMFSLLSSLCSSTNVRPDVCLKLEDGSPVLLAEIVSTAPGGESASLKQTLMKSASNTIDMLRLYMNLRDSRIAEVSSVVLPKEGHTTTSAVIVTAKFCSDSWKFFVAFERVQKEDVCRQMESIILRHCDFLHTCPKYLGPWFLVRIYDLPVGFKQIASKHSIVLKTDKMRILKFTPRQNEQNQLLSLVIEKLGALDGVNGVAVTPEAVTRIKSLRFFDFPAVEPPLSREQICLCFSDFVVQSAIALRILHTTARIAHQDIRTFNIGYVRGPNREARVVFIDLDRSTFELTEPVATSKTIPQYQKPAKWPTDVEFDALRSDWRQWALMIWSLLDRKLETRIYGGGVTSSDMAFLDGILHGTGEPFDAMSEESLVAELRDWLGSAAVQALKRADPHIDSSTLTEQVLPNLFSPIQISIKTVN